MGAAGIALPHDSVLGRALTSKYDVDYPDCVPSEAARQFMAKATS
jgi:hypothetical protein